MLLLIAALAASVPGVVIDHWPQVGGQYVGSPGIAILPGGTYVAKMDLFGPQSTENTRAVTRLFQSTDKGKTWLHLTDVQGMYWASLFYHRGALYLLGPEKQYGNLIIMRSVDRGRTWKQAILAEGRYHTAPVPFVVHKGRLWRALEDADGPGGWGSRFRALMMSAPVKADLLRRESWTFTNSVPGDPAWLDGKFGGWLEGNAVLTPQGRVVDILRVDHKTREYGAVVDISSDGKQASFDSRIGFFPFPGGAKKFTIRYDKQSKRYWSLSNVVPAQFAGRPPAATRNTLALIHSSDLRTWTPGPVILQHPDPDKHGFQYVDWLIEGNDIVFVCRTAFDDESGGAHNYHDANFLTFHRIPNFRNLR
jgi:hypothetical protein